MTQAQIIRARLARVDAVAERIPLWPEDRFDLRAALLSLNEAIDALDAEIPAPPRRNPFARLIPFKLRAFS